MTSLDIVAAEVAAWDASRARSQQTAIGASGLYGCRAASVLRMNEVPPSDGRLRWDALVGTSIHAVCEQAAPSTVLVEQRFTFDGVTATVDRYDPERRTLTDLKTKANAAAIAKVQRYGPDDRHIAQVMLGAAALQDAGHAVDAVELLYLPRDGRVEDGWLWTGTPDRDAAVRAAEWARKVTVEAASRAGLDVDGQVDGLRDEPESFCRAYCEWATLCRGPVDVPVVDELVAATVQEYVEADAAEKAAKAAKDVARRFLEPYTSLPGLRWQGGNTRSSEEIDLDRVLADYRQVFGEPPTRTVEKTTPRSLRRVG